MATNIESQRILSTWMWWHVVRPIFMCWWNVVLPSSGLKNCLTATCFHCLLYNSKDGDHVFPQNLDKLLLDHMGHIPEVCCLLFSHCHENFTYLQSYLVGNTTLNISNEVYFFVHLNSTLISHINNYLLRASWVILIDSAEVISINISV